MSPNRAAALAGDSDFTGENPAPSLLSALAGDSPAELRPGGESGRGSFRPCSPPLL